MHQRCGTDTIQQPFAGNGAFGAFVPFVAPVAETVAEPFSGRLDFRQAGLLPQLFCFFHILLFRQRNRRHRIFHRGIDQYLGFPFSAASQLGRVTVGLVVAYLNIGGRIAAVGNRPHDLLHAVRVNILVYRHCYFADGTHQYG